MAIDRRERLRAAVGVAVGLMVAGALSRWLQGPWAGQAAGAWLVAPLGASAVLVFVLPASPLAQPWPVVGGNLVSALAGLAVMSLGGQHLWPPLAVALAAGLGVAAMMAARCLHPPGGGTAALMVLAGVSDWRFALFPVATNVLLLVAAGVAYNRATGRAYPHPDRPAPAAAHADEPPVRFSEADIDRALARYNQVLDVPRDDLRALLEAAETESLRRRMGELRCRDIMSHDVRTVSYGTALQDAWALLRQHRIKALPVVERSGRLVGIVTQADFLRGADLDVLKGFDERLRQLIRATPGSHSDKPEVVGQIMTRQVRVTRDHRSLAEMLPLFSATGHHHIPVLGEGDRLVGILTQTDLVRALGREQGLTSG
ncbi:HPP family protein [Ideonella sp. DXS22W]|uniref:HPP family protein n=1 Tax=Pseudaquabacterium inlustre TaxID=2984192 RepID=A0ABU9CEM3_9BURK